MLEDFYLQSKWRRCILGETFGTIILTVTVVTSSAILTPYPYLAAFAIGAQVIALTFVGAGFLNPAIATGVTLVRIRRGSVARRPGVVKLAFMQLLSFIVVEFLAAFAGCLIGYGLLGTGEQRAAFPAPEPNQGMDSALPRAMLAEFFFTFQLVYVMVFTCVAKEFDRVNVNRFLGPGLGCIIFVGSIVAGPISGGAMNPAIASALQIFQCIIQQGASQSHCRPLTFIWMYWLVEILAGIAAALAFLLVSNESDPSEHDEVVFVDESMRTAADDDGSDYTGSNEKAGGTVTFEVNAPPTGPRSTAGPRSSERDSLIQRRRSSVARIRPRQTGGGGMHTLVDLDG